MKKLMNLCAATLLLSSATICCAQAPPAAAPAAPAAPAAAPAKPVAPPPKATKPGIAVPAWQAAVVSGDMKSLSSADLKGKAYGIVFVNNACAACRQEMSDILKLKFDSSKFTLIVAAVDANMDRALGVYRDEMKVTYPIINDSKFMVADVFDFGITPASVIVGEDGKLEYRVTGFTAETQKATLAAFQKYLK
jgi:peroxiredoxin